MSGFWLPVGLLIASIGLGAAEIARKRNRITWKTHRLIRVVWSLVVIMLGCGLALSSHQMAQPVRDLGNIKLRADALQNRIKTANDVQRQLAEFSDPQQGADTAGFLKLRTHIREEAAAISAEGEALTKELSRARSRFDALNEARMQRDFALVLCVLVLASTLLVGALYRDFTQRRR